jgi:4,5:9,10-diseco-3-hydroxy-5,9,17-trioxoandrosta-1(10),2-diene-4-oate hydrolase
MIPNHSQLGMIPMFFSIVRPGLGLVLALFVSLQAIAESGIVEPKIHKVQAGPFQIAYRVLGPIHATPVILLHGGGPGVDGWTSFSRNFAALSQKHRVYLIDFPGWGRSSKNLQAGAFLSPFRNGGRAVIAFMDALGMPKAHLVGNSFGGTAALYAALTQSERFDRLVLLSPGGADTLATQGPSKGVELTLNYYQDEGPTLKKMQALLGELVFDPSKLTPAFAKDRLRASLDPAVLRNPPFNLPPGKAPREVLVSNDPKLKSLPHPVLVIWGKEDRINPVEGAASFAAIPSLRTVFLDRTGHWPQWESAASTNELILQHLSPN